MFFVFLGLGSMKLPKLKSLFMGGVATVLFTSVIGTSALASTTLRLSTLYKPGSDGVIAAEAMAKRVAERTEGRVTINVYPADQLGDWVEVHDQVAGGSVDIAMQPLSTTSDRRLAIGWFPYTFATYDSVEQAMSRGGFVDTIVSEIIEEQGMKLLGVFGVGMGGAGFANAIDDPGNPDLKRSLKVRVWPGGVTHRHLMERFGFSVATIPAAELFTAMQTGVIDGQIGATAELTYDNLREVTHTWVQYNDHFESNWIFMNNRRFQSLEPADQQILLDVAQEITKERFAELKERDEEHQQRLRDFGVEVVTFSDDELEALAAVVRQDVWPKISSELGDDVYRRLKAEVGVD